MSTSEFKCAYSDSLNSDSVNRADIRAMGGMCDVHHRLYELRNTVRQSTAPPASHVLSAADVTNWSVKVNVGPCNAASEGQSNHPATSGLRGATKLNS